MCIRDRSKGGGEIPWYVFELPVVVIGCGQPTMLADVPQARTYINTYDAVSYTHLKPHGVREVGQLYGRVQNCTLHSI